MGEIIDTNCGCIQFEEDCKSECQIKLKDSIEASQTAWICVTVVVVIVLIVVAVIWKIRRGRKSDNDDRKDGRKDNQRNDVELNCK